MSYRCPYGLLYRPLMVILKRNSVLTKGPIKQGLRETATYFYRTP
nr:MAG TPA: hypothetical protein [Caudoviricetes sp.]